MRAYIQRFESETETNGAGTAFAAVPGLTSTNVDSTLGRVELPLENEHLKNASKISAVKRVANSPQDKPCDVDWVMVAIWSFAVFSFGALLFCLFGINAKCHGDLHF